MFVTELPAPVDSYQFIPLQIGHNGLAFSQHILIPLHEMILPALRHDVLVICHNLYSLSCYSDKITQFLAGFQAILIHKACGSFILFPNHQVSWQANLFCFTPLSVHIIAFRQIIVKLSYKCATYAGTFLVDRV